MSFFLNLFYIAKYWNSGWIKILFGNVHAINPSIKTSRWHTVSEEMIGTSLKSVNYYTLFSVLQDLVTFSLDLISKILSFE